MKLILLVGGRSTEHDASLHSYAHVIDEVLKHPDELDLAAVVYVDRSGGFHASSQAPWPTDEASLRRPSPMTVSDALDLMAGTYCFSLLHGSEGEDGAWQGLAEVFGLEGSFGPILASALSMNKRIQSLVATQLAPGLAIPPTWAVRPHTRLSDIVPELTGRPIVVKPNQMGASLLTQHLTNYDEEILAAAVSEIFRFDAEALIQQYISGIEYSCGVIEDHGQAVALPVMQIETDEGFFGHQQKHQHDQARSRIVPSSGVAEEVQRYSERLFAELGLLGWARFDYIVSPDATYFLEINSIPGLMSGSLFPQMLNAAGLRIIDLIMLTAQCAGRRSRREKHLAYRIDH